MILRDRDIIELIEAGTLTFNPPLEKGQIGSSAIDLRLGYNFSVHPYDTSSLPQNVKSILSQTVDLRDESKVVEFITYLRKENNQHLQDGGHIDIQPRSLLLAETLESITLPTDIAARVEGRSTYARLGLTVHQTAPSVKPGWSGQLTLEIVNNGSFTYRLYPRMRLCQLILEEMKGPVQSPDPNTWGNLRFGTP
jgi:dCTP deaminase